MNARFILSAILGLMIVSFSVASLSAADQRDLIILKSNQKSYAIIDSERSNALLIRATVNSQQKEQRMHEVKSWEYKEMSDGYWPQALQARDQGRLAIAADMFNALATTGDREWMKVYGAYNEGICWELLGDYTKAADAFGRAAAVEPLHRLAMDAQYRQGFALARKKDNAGAEAIAKALDDIFTKDRDKGAEARARAIRTVLAYNKGDGEALKKEGRSTVFPTDDIEASVQFGTFFAGGLRQLGKLREAKAEYERLLSIPGLSAPSRVPLQLGYAKTVLDDGDTASALVELLSIDALPYGTIDDKCEARFLAGKQLLAEVVAVRAEGALTGERKEFIDAQERTARLLLTAAANSSSSLTAKSAAQKELETMGPDPDAPVEEPAAEGAVQATELKSVPVKKK